MNDISYLRQYTKNFNWGFDHELPIEDELWDDAEQMLEQLADLPKPFVSPCGDQTIHLSWNIGEDTYVIEVGKEKYYWSECTPDDICQVTREQAMQKIKTVHDRSKN